MPPVDKIHEVPDDVWDVVFQGFLSQELLRGLDIPVMDERAIEEFEKWSDDENEVVSSTTSTSGELTALVPVTQTRFRTVTNDQLQTAIKKWMNVWCAWCDERKVEENIVEMSSDRMNSLLSRFVNQTADRSPQ